MSFTISVRCEGGVGIVVWGLCLTRRGTSRFDNEMYPTRALIASRVTCPSCLAPPKISNYTEHRCLLCRVSRPLSYLLRSCALQCQIFCRTPELRAPTISPSPTSAYEKHDGYYILFRLLSPRPRRLVEVFPELSQHPADRLPLPLVPRDGAREVVGAGVNPTEDDLQAVPPEVVVATGVDFREGGVEVFRCARCIGLERRGTKQSWAWMAFCDWVRNPRRPTNYTKHGCSRPGMTWSAF